MYFVSSDLAVTVDDCISHYKTTELQDANEPKQVKFASFNLDCHQLTQRIASTTIDTPRHTCLTVIYRYLTLVCNTLTAN